MENRDIDFIARHYRSGRFEVNSGWNRLGLASVSLWKGFRVAAAVAATVLISATAAILYREYHTSENQQQDVAVHAVGPLGEVKVIDFENAPLMEVVNQIEQTYDVKVENLPDLNNEYMLSLHYEGTPTELIAVINDILGTQMTVVEK